MSYFFIAAGLCCFLGFTFLSWQVFAGKKGILKDLAAALDHLHRRLLQWSQGCLQRYVCEYFYSEDLVEDELKAVITEERLEGLVLPEQLGGGRALSCGSGNTKGWGVLRCLPRRLLEQLVCHHGGAVCWGAGTDRVHGCQLLPAVQAPGTWPGPWPLSTVKNARQKGSPFQKNGWGCIWVGTCLSCHCLIIRALMAACCCWQVSVTVQTFKGFKPLTIPLSTWLQCRMRWDPFLMYCTEGRYTRKRMRGQRALRALCNKSGKSQNLLGQGVCVCFCTA